MSKYTMGVDFSSNDDCSAYTVVRGLRWYDKLLRKLGISKATWQWKVVDTWTQKEPTPQKYRRPNHKGRQL